VDGASQGALSSYTFTNVPANHTIEVSFAVNTYSLTPSAGTHTHGAITPATAVTVRYGGSQTFNIIPNTN
jgi:hypothetical protein